MRQDWSDLFADNIRDYQGYSIGQLFKYLGDPEIISLAGGLPSPKVFLKTELQQYSKARLEVDGDNIMQYSPIGGEPHLIEAVIRFLERDGIQVSAENVVITSSGQQGLDLIGRAFLNPGDSLLVDRPTFAGALIAFQMQRPVFVGLDLQKDGSDIDGLRRRIETLHRDGRPPKFIYVVPDFQNPTGITTSLEKREALLDLSYEYDFMVVEDSPYRDLRYHGSTIPSLYRLDQQREGGRVMGVYTFSKLFCPGMRVGFNIGPPAVIAKLLKIKEGSTLNTPKYNQDMCAAFLTEVDLDAYLKRCRDYYRQKLEAFTKRLAACFAAMPGVSWTQPEGGLFLWMTLPAAIDTFQLFHEALKHKVAFVPGQAFYAENPSRCHMRINFSYPSRSQLGDAAERLAACLQNFL